MVRPRREIVLILARDLASQLSTPMFIVDSEGTLIYFNEPAEVVLGRTWAEAGELSSDEWGSMFRPRTLDDEPIPPEQLPLVIAFTERQAGHRSMRITALDGRVHDISLTAIPLMPHADEIVGAVAVFWDAD